MTNAVTISDAEELSRYKTTILSNLKKSVQDIRTLIEGENAQEIFMQFKFEKVATEPLSGKPENLVEVINQSQTYFVTLTAVEYLLLLASGDNRHSGSGEKRQFWSTENSHLQFE